MRDLAMERERAAFYEDKRVLQADTDRTVGFVAGKADAKAGRSCRTDKAFRSIAWLQGYDRGRHLFTRHNNS